jgi:hypothetical protein
VTEWDRGRRTHGGRGYARDQGFSMTVRAFVWGMESWEMGSNDFVIRFTEGRVRIRRITGNATAAPQPDFKPFAQVIRQTLATMINVGAPADPPDIQLIGTPANRANHSMQAHLFSLNVKQTNDQTLNIPIDYTFDDPPVVLAQNLLLMRIVNESYKMHNYQAVISDDQNDSLNLELHMRIIYEVEG